VRTPGTAVQRPVVSALLNVPVRTASQLQVVHVVAVNNVRHVTPDLSVNSASQSPYVSAHMASRQYTQIALKMAKNVRPVMMVIWATVAMKFVQIGQLPIVSTMKQPNVGTIITRIATARRIGVVIQRTVPMLAIAAP